MIITNRKKNLLLFIILIFCFIIDLYFLDIFIFPKKTIIDKIHGYKELSINHSSRIGLKQKTHFGYKYITVDNKTFSSDKFYFDEENIEIEQTRVFNFISNVKTIEKNYKYNLISGINGFIFYFIMILFISLNSSAIILLFKKNINENIFYNVILFNFFVLFCIAALYFYT